MAPYNTPAQPQKLQRLGTSELLCSAEKQGLSRESQQHRCRRIAAVLSISTSQAPPHSLPRSGGADTIDAPAATARTRGLRRGRHTPQQPAAPPLANAPFPAMPGCSGITSDSKQHSNTAQGRGSHQLPSKQSALCAEQALVWSLIKFGNVASPGDFRAI